MKIIRAARKSGSRIRLIGSGHSFVPWSETRDLLISLNAMQGIVSVDAEENYITFWAGTKLKLLGKILHQQGLAMENLGDIDRQSIAGAICTGTHGTGLSFGNLSTQVSGLEFVNGKGEVIWCSENENRDLFQFARLSLGALGVITKVQLRLVPSFLLQMERKKEGLEKVLAELEDRVNTNRHFEFYWFPYTQTVQTKTANVSDGPKRGGGVGAYLNDVILENATFGLLCQLAKLLPSLNKGISRLSAKAVSGNRKIGDSHKVFATPRYVRFNEMEYSLPLENYKDAFYYLRKLINTEKFDIHFPIEHRFVAGDAIPLSPANGRNSAYIALHVYRGKACEPYFTEAESILREFGGRPHWGKWHHPDPEFFKSAYPQWLNFLRIRNEMDPEHVFVNKWMGRVVGGK